MTPSNRSTLVTVCGLIALTSMGLARAVPASGSPGFGEQVLPGITSQDTTRADSAAAPAQPDLGPTGPLLPSQVPRQAERDEARRIQIADSLTASTRLAAARSAVDALTRDLEVISEYESVEVTGRMGLRDLEAVRQQWRSISRRSTEISGEISGALDRYERWGIEAQAMLSRWEVTMDAADTSALHLPTIPQIQLSLLGTNDLIERLDSLELEILSLASTTSSIESRVRAAAARTTESLAQVRRRLLAPNQRPIWLVPLSEFSPVVAAREAAIFLDGRLGFVLEYVNGNLYAFLTHLLVILLIAAFIRWLSGFIDRASLDAAGGGGGDADGDDGEGEEGPGEEPASRGAGEPVESPAEEDSLEELGPPRGIEALVSGRQEDWAALRSVVVLGHRPLSAGYLISLLFMPLIYGQTPILVSDMLFLLSMIPAARLVLSVPDSRLRSGALSLLALSIGTYLVNTGLSAAQAKRVLLLLIAAGTLVLLRRILAWVRDVEAPPLILRLFVGVARAMWWGLVVAVVGSMLGLTNLASLMVVGIVSLLYVSLLFRILYLALEGTLRVLPFTPLSRNLISIRSHPELLAKKGRVVTQLALGALWVAIALRFFGLTGTFSGVLSGLLALGIDVGNLHVDLGDVIAFVGAIWVALLVSRLLRFVFMEDVVPRAGWPKGIPEAIAALSHYAILTIGFAVALIAANIPMDRVALLVSAFGIGIGFGLQNIVNNFVSGLILLFERPLSVGDTVEMGPLLGEVKRIGIRASAVRTFDGAEVIVPNSELVQSQVVNWTLSDRTRRMEVKVGVKYGTDPEKVLPLLRAAASSHPEVLQEPPPTALFREFGDSSLNFSVRFWIAEHERFLLVWSEVTVAVNRALAEAGIEIPFPQRDLHLKSVTEGAEAALGRSVGGTSADDSDRTEDQNTHSGESDA